MDARYMSSELYQMVGLFESVRAREISIIPWSLFGIYGRLYHNNINYGGIIRDTIEVSTICIVNLLFYCMDTVPR